MARVVLNISPYEAPGAASVQVYESATVDGPFVLVDTLAAGVYPDYVTRIDTNLATNDADWFAVQWLAADGAELTPLSPPIRAQAYSFVQMVADRVRQRDPSLNEDVVIQEAEGAIERYLGKNPYAADFYLDLLVGTRYNVLNGLVYLTMARSMLDRLIKTSNVTKATIGVVSMQSGDTTTSVKNIEALIGMANDLLGLTYSLVMVLEDIEIGNSVRGVMWRDQSRLVLETEIL
jgi:hypothetical protein